jgi:hypothetical protein
MLFEQIQKLLFVLGIEAHVTNNLFRWLRCLSVAQDGAITNGASAFEKPALLGSHEELIPLRRRGGGLSVAMNEKDVLSHLKRGRKRMAGSFMDFLRLAIRVAPFFGCCSVRMRSGPRNWFRRRGRRIHPLD